LLQAINLLEFFEILEKNVFGEDDLPGVQKVSILKSSTKFVFLQKRLIWAFNQTAGI